MHNPKRLTALTGALGLAMLLGAANTVPAGSSAGEPVAEYGPANYGDNVGQSVSWSSIQDGYACSCVETYMGGREASVASCDNTQDRCADIDILIDCQDDPDGPDCEYLSSCECDCTALEETVEFEHGPFEDVVLTGIPDLWQFNFMCGSNAVSTTPRTSSRPA